MKTFLRAYLVSIITILSIFSCDNSRNRSTASSDMDSTTMQENRMDNSNFWRYQFKNDSVQISLTLHKADSVTMKFDLLIQKQNSVEKNNGLAELIRLEREDGTFYIPEGTAILDKNTKQEYTCDSTYSYDSKKVSLGFGLEQKTKKRISLTVSNSTIELLKDEDFTLYKVQ